MDYRFEISLPTSSDFRCEIAVGGEQTFQQFHDKIVETLNYGIFFHARPDGKPGERNCIDGYDDRGRGK